MIQKDQPVEKKVSDFRKCTSLYQFWLCSLHDAASFGPSFKERHHVETSYSNCLFRISYRWGIGTAMASLKGSGFTDGKTNNMETKKM